MRRNLFLVGLLLELICVFGLFVPYIHLVSSGTTASLETVPVDPRSVFRGDYVSLSYVVGQGIADTEPYGEQMYVVLAPKGEVFERVSMSKDKPVLAAGQICLRGTTTYRRIDFPDIAQYFVEEGFGHELEQARNSHRLLVDIAVDSSCHAVITGVRVGQEAPLEDDSSVMPAPRPMPVK